MRRVGRGQIRDLVLGQVADERLGHGRAVTLDADHAGVDHFLVQGQTLLDVVGGVLQIKFDGAAVDAAVLVDVFHTGLEACGIRHTHG